MKVLAAFLRVRSVWLPTLLFTFLIYTLLFAYVLGHIDVPFLYRAAQGP